MGVIFTRYTCVQYFTSYDKYIKIRIILFSIIILTIFSYKYKIFEFIYDKCISIIGSIKIKIIS